MARIIQVLVPLLCVVLAEAQVHMPFFDHIPGLPHPARPISDGPRDRPTHKNIGYNGGYDTWFQHFGNPDGHSFNSDSHERDKSYEDYDPFYHGDTYYEGNGWDQMPGINNVFNIPNPGYNDHRDQPAHKRNDLQEKSKQDHNDGSIVQKPEEKPKEIPPIDKKLTEQNKGPKLNEDNIPDVNNKLNEADISHVKNNSDLLPPKTNEIKKRDENVDKDNKQVGLDKKKDFLLVGQGNNRNDVYLLHENNPNPSTVITPNANQPGNNIIYVPYNPGQTNNPVYQVINGQPGSLPTNAQMTQDKVGVSSGYNNAVSNPGQSNTNLNTGIQNPGYVTIYSNGQLMQIPGVVVNSVPNSVPIQNGNQVQGTNYIIANTFPNNVQSIPAVQQPGTNVIYATIPNQASNGPIYVQVPNCVNAMANGCGSSTVQGVNNGISSNGLPSNLVFYQANPNTVTQSAVLPNDVSNSYVQPNMMENHGQGAVTVAFPNQGAIFSNQNGQYQQAVELPVNSGSNGYNQPIVSNLGLSQNAPNQGGMVNNQYMPIQTAVQMPVDSSNSGYKQPIVYQGQGQNIPNQGATQMPSATSNNGYNQPMVSSQRQEVNAPNQGVLYNKYTTPQPTVQMPVNNDINYQPKISNQVQGPNVPNQGVTANNQNTPLQPAVEIPIPNGYNVNPPVTNPNPTVNVESRGDMSNNQIVQPQPSVTVNSGSNGYQQPQVPKQGGINAIVNIPNNGEVINQESDNAQPLATSSLVLDDHNLSSLGAQPAIMISDFKDKSGDKKDIKKSKDKKEKKDKGKKKDKKPKEGEKPKVSEPFTNKMEDVKR